MKNTKVVHIGVGWGVMAEWNRVRTRLAAGTSKGFFLVMDDEDGRDSVLLGGVYKDDPQRALSAILKISAARMLAEDPPLPKQAHE